MWTEAADLEILMERLAEAGVSMLLRVDVERYNENTPHWTLAFGGPALDSDTAFRVDARTLGQCVSRGLRRLRDQHESWDWLDDWV
ncbi:hypothetical protein [Nocardia sp. NPDC056100]|uniref:hypothetical protein n=1 Tax=Nocardia sp. NPDC056100 TaxID=3345712 RepID=UPI0035E1D02E